MTSGPRRHASLSAVTRQSPQAPFVATEIPWMIFPSLANFAMNSKFEINASLALSSQPSVCYFP